MKRLIFCFIYLFSLLGCSDSNVFDSNSIDLEKTSTVIKSSTVVKPVVTITLRFNFGRERGLSGRGLPAGDWVYLSQGWVNPVCDTYFGCNTISLTLRNVDVWNSFDNSVNVSFWGGDSYSDFFPALSRADTYVDINSLKVMPASLYDQYDFHWNVEGLPCHAEPSFPSDPDPDPIDPNANKISLEWNGTTWDIVAQYPVTSDLSVTCGGPEVSGYDWFLLKGTKRLSTGITSNILEIDWVSPNSDDTYNYTFR